MALEDEKMPTCNNFLYHIIIIVFTCEPFHHEFFFIRKERKLCFISSESFHLYTKDIFAWVGRSFNSISRSHAKLFRVSFSHFLHPKFVLFWSFFSLSIFLFNFYVRMYVCYMLNQFHIDDDGRNINIKERSSMTLIAKNSLSIYFLYRRVHNESNRTSL